MKITDEMVGAAMLAYMKETAAEEFQVSGWLESALRAALTAALAVQTQQGVEVKKLETGSAPDRLWLHPEHGVLSGPLDGSEVAYERSGHEACAERDYYRGAEADFESYVQQLRQARGWE
jgi:hypothetical protein